MKYKNYIKYLCITITVMLFHSITYMNVHAYDNEVKELLETSDEKIIEAFINLYDAELSGYDATEELNKLKLLIEYLHSERYNPQDDYSDEKLHEIEIKISELYQFVEETNNIKNSAIVEQERVRTSVFVKTVLYVAVLGLVIYGLNRYTGSTGKNILNYKPEANKDTA